MAEKREPASEKRQGSGFRSGAGDKDRWRHPYEYLHEAYLSTHRNWNAVVKNGGRNGGADADSQETPGWTVRSLGM